MRSHDLVLRLGDGVGALSRVTGAIADAGANILAVETGSRSEDGSTVFSLEIATDTLDDVVRRLSSLPEVLDVAEPAPFDKIFGSRVIIIGGGAQVAAVASGAVQEADRHNIRGERISVDTIPLVGEEAIAEAVRAVPRLPRARVLVLAGSLMGGAITDAVREARALGIPVISLNQAGSVVGEVDLVVADPLQAGVMAVMSIASTARFDLSRVRGRSF